MSQNLRALVEMAADDSTRRVCELNALARALCRLATASVPSVALGASDGRIAGRVERVLAPRPSARLVVLASGLSTLGVLALPFVVLLMTYGGR